MDPRVSAFIAAIFISFARILYRAALQYVGVGVSTVIMSLVSVIVGYIFLKIEGKVEIFPLYATLLFMGVGISANLVGRYFSLVSINLVGLSRTSILMQTSLVWSAAFAILFLNEEVSVYVFWGTLAVMFGSILLVYEKDTNYSNVPFTHFLVPVVTAITFALAHILGKTGLRIVDSAPFAQTVSNATSFVAMFLIFLSSKEFKVGGWKKMNPICMVSLGALLNAMAAFFFLDCSAYRRYCSSASNKQTECFDDNFPFLVLFSKTRKYFEASCSWGYNGCSRSIFCGSR
ncbi:MAG: DMT family transporter [Nitrospinota bacterium]|nr:DMT family transporter [Nitrospinota bacterium]